jgi:hypothetical protein
MSSRTRFAVAGGAVVAAATLIVAAPSSAGAAPANGPEFTVTCPGEDPFTVVTPPGNGAFTPAFIEGTRQVAIPYQVTGTVTVDGQVVDSFNDVKKAPTPANAVTCSFEGTFTEGDMTATVAGTVVVVLRGH